MAAPAVTLELPAVLEPIAGCTRLKVNGASIPEALESAFAQVPVLRQHLVLEDGELRPHILCLVNGVTVQRAMIADAQLSAGDEIMIHQAISGG